MKAKLNYVRPTVDITEIPLDVFKGLVVLVGISRLADVNQHCHTKISGEDWCSFYASISDFSEYLRKRDL